MALAASPPPATHSNNNIDTLDSEIVQIRAEIQNLTKRRNILSASLLSTFKVQTHLDQQQNGNREVNIISAEADNVSQNDSFPKDLSSLLSTGAIKQHTQSNVHRIGFGVTAFPFTDPSPDISSLPLLGIRFDICTRTGKFASPYYILCKRVNETDPTPDTVEDNAVHDNDNHKRAPELKIYRHTIPALVPLEEYERRYLPTSHFEIEGYEALPDADESLMNEISRPKQDIHALVERVRCDLVSWHQRQDAIDLMREQLELPDRDPPSQTNTKSNPTNTEDEMDIEDDENATTSQGKFSITSLEPISVDCLSIRIVWTDGRVGRVRFNHNGTIDRVVVIGDQGRMKDAERLLGGNGTSVYNLVMRLGDLQRRREEGIMR